jgi:hypothetical protein
MAGPGPGRALLVLVTRAAARASTLPESLARWPRPQRRRRARIHVTHWHAGQPALTQWHSVALSETCAGQPTRSLHSFWPPGPGLRSLGAAAARQPQHHQYRTHSHLEGWVKLYNMLHYMGGSYHIFLYNARLHNMLYSTF